MNSQLLQLPLLLLAGTVGCGGNESSDRRAETDVERETVQIDFEATAAERLNIGRAARAARRQLEAAHVAVSASRFGTSPSRYVLFVVPPQEIRSGNIHFALATADDDSSVVLFDTLVPFSPTNGVWVGRIALLDRDSLPDIVYCVNIGKPAPKGLGFRNGKWYAIDRLSPDDRASCAAPAS